MSHGAGDRYRGYYIKTVVRPINPGSMLGILYEGEASVALDPASRFGVAAAPPALGDDSVFGTEFEAHRYAERAARRYIDQLHEVG